MENSRVYPLETTICASCIVELNRQDWGNSPNVSCNKPPGLTQRINCGACAREFMFACDTCMNAKIRALSDKIAELEARINAKKS